VNIPLSIGLSGVAGEILVLAGVSPAQAADLLQRWAAVLSKLASDSIAGIIEGLADKAAYLRMRSLDYAGKLTQLLDTYAQLEIAFPMEDVLALLASTKQFLQAVEHTRRDLVDILVVNALDLLYFWMYQPRAREVFRTTLRRMTPEERTMLLRSQRVLSRERRIGQLFIDGLIGRKFSAPLAFYLSTWRTYLREIHASSGAGDPVPNVPAAPFQPDSPPARDY
jgi:hypothetical protein